MFEKLVGKVDLVGVFQALKEVVADPTSNLLLSVLLLSVASLILLILVVIVLFVFVGQTDEDEEGETDEDAEEDGEETATPEEPAADAAPLADVDELMAGPGSGDSSESTIRPARASVLLAAVAPVVVPLLFLAVLVSSYIVTAQDRYCVTCHGDKVGKVKVSESASASGEDLGQVHAFVRCVACHEGPQSTAILGNVLDRSRHVWSFVLGGRDARFASIPSARCQRCHTGVLTRVVVSESSGLRTSHREPLAAGLECTNCHTDTGHLPGAERPGMSVCVRCHDGKKAAAECKTCHTKGTAVAASSERIFAPHRVVNKGDCGGCHSQDTCDACHGLRMPHDIAFLRGEHARLAGFQKKQMCWRCHMPNDCGKCHSINIDGVWGHPSDWKSIHMKVTPGTVAGCGCHGRSPYVQQGKDYCLACHNPGIR